MHRVGHAAAGWNSLVVDGTGSRVDYGFAVTGGSASNLSVYVDGEKVSVSAVPPHA